MARGCPEGVRAGATPPVAAETMPRRSAQGCTRQNSLTFFPPAPPLEVIPGQCTDREGRILLSSLEAAPVGDALGLPCQEWDGSAAQALLLLRPLPGLGPGYGAGGGQLREGATRRPDVRGCWLQAAPLPHPPGCTLPSGLDGGPGRGGRPFSGSSRLWGSDIGARSPWKRGGGGGRRCKITARRWKPKRPSAPRLAPHRPCVTRYCCVWQKTHGETPLKCRFPTLPEARGKKNPFAPRGICLSPGAESR